MPLARGELERLSDDVYLNRRITASTYCAGCGYNLRTLPYVYTCPECGQPYNARPLHMKGIFVPGDFAPPAGLMVMMGICLLLATPLLLFAFNPLDNVKLIVGGFFLVLALVQGMLVLRQLRRNQVARDIARRIAEENA